MRGWRPKPVQGAVGRSGGPDRARRQISKGNKAQRSSTAPQPPPAGPDPDRPDDSPPYSPRIPSPESAAPALFPPAPARPSSAAASASPCPAPPPAPSTQAPHRPHQRSRRPAWKRTARSGTAARPLSTKVRPRAAAKPQARLQPSALFWHFAGVGPHWFGRGVIKAPQLRRPERGLDYRQCQHYKGAGQHEQQPRNQPAARAMGAPADPCGQLHRLGTGQEHAKRQRRKILGFADPAPFLDQPAVHQRDLRGGAAKG